MSVAETVMKGVTLWSGDCLDVLKALETNSIDSCVTDPPYHLTSIVKRFSAENAAPAKFYKTGAYGGGFKADGKGTGAAFARMSRGFMGKAWDGGDIAFQADTWREVYRVLKPGAHLLACGGTRTYHRLACAIEDAGFEIRDAVLWHYGSGFPKSHDVSKGIDRAAGVERKVVGKDRNFGKSRLEDGKNTFGDYAGEWDISRPATDAARAWEGWGTALKPATEIICLARKPLSEKTVAANVLKWGTGALNIDGCRVATEELTPRNNNNTETLLQKGFEGESKTINPSPLGRWPANLIHDGSNEVVAGFPETAPAKTGLRGEQHSNRHGGLSDLGSNINSGTNSIRGIDDSGGSAARFFYTAKANQDDRLGSKHPTVKPVDLIQYLVRLITPPKGLCLDPFAGTGTTGEACIREGFRAILIEREAEYQEDIRRRMKLAMAGPDERTRESIKAKTKDKPLDHGPLFGVNT